MAEMCGRMHGSVLTHGSASTRVSNVRVKIFEVDFISIELYIDVVYVILLCRTLNYIFGNYFSGCNQSNTTIASYSSQELYRSPHEYHDKYRLRMWASDHDLCGQYRHPPYFKFWVKSAGHDDNLRRPSEIYDWLSVWTLIFVHLLGFYVENIYAWSGRLTKIGDIEGFSKNKAMCSRFISLVELLSMCWLV